MVKANGTCEETEKKVNTIFNKEKIIDISKIFESFSRPFDVLFWNEIID